MEPFKKEILEYLQERGWDKLEPADIAKSVCIEASELLEHFQWGSPKAEDIKRDPEKFLELKREVADVFIYLLEMSIALDFSPEEAIREKLEYVKKKYPVERIKAGAYATIKKEFREK